MSQTTPTADFAGLEVDDPTILPAGFPVGEASDAELQDVLFGSVPSGADNNALGAYLAAPEPMTDSQLSDDVPSQSYTQEALLKAAESGDYAKVVDLVTQNTSQIDRLVSGSRPIGEARGLSGPDIWYDMLDTKYLGNYMRGSISFADTIISGGKELWDLGGDIGNYMLGTNRSVMSGEFMPASQLGMSIQTKGWGQTGLDLFSGIVHAPFEVAAGMYHNDPERVGSGLTFWAPALGITSRFSRGSATTASSATRARIEANIAESRAARESSNFNTSHVAEIERIQTAKDFYSAQGFSGARLESHVAGIDFSQPVNVVRLDSGAQLSQFALNTDRIGNYFTDVNANRFRLGIYVPTARMKLDFSVTQPTSALRSTTADFNYTSRDYFARGGETQYFVGSDFLQNFRLSQ
ncbi:hypothetical protein A3194_12535 [Candidatus Thiodiazotropha endoloripes]|uniref:polymorphic toxin type 46 domain-containing protein n=1 Tax=Candidatus Thiodiazotropha endoloripes TaxID=1818881 RepID=UPI00083E413C|nr:polymorphic toxin type 46 domain-containing protein [Candidatus Thiodiazotropha endoloripes]ODB85654.1 hypothetical protein A3194_12535 [Candidatus Thiodiazotropha endoloripes]